MEGRETVLPSATVQLAVEDVRPEVGTFMPPSASCRIKAAVLGDDAVALRRLVLNMSQPTSVGHEDAGRWDLGGGEQLFCTDVAIDSKLVKVNWECWDWDVDHELIRNQTLFWDSVRSSHATIIVANEIESAVRC